MFPIPWNFPLRKKNGKLVNIGDAIDAGTEIPEHGTSDAGKVLSVDANGDLEWSDEFSSEIQTLTNEVDTVVNVFGVKNILPNYATSKTENGVTFTVNSDGSVSVSTESGGATANTAFDILSNEYFDSLHLDDNKEYVLSGCPSGGNYDNGYCLKYNYQYNGTWYLLNNIDIGNGKTITPQSGRTGEVVQIRVASGTVITTPILFKPMIRPTEIVDSTYVPYAMTNRELTDNATYKKGDTIVISSNPLYLFALFQNSKELRCTIPINKPISASGATVTINSVQVFNNGNNEQISSGITGTANKVDGVGLYIIIDNEVDFTTFTAFANAIIRFNNVSITFT